MVNVLLSCLSFKEYTGSELYFYELATALKENGHDVHIFSLIHGAPLTEEASDVIFVDEYTVDNIEYDLVIFSHGSNVWNHIKNVRTKKIINVIHSEVLELEEPLINSKVSLYVGIRPSIVEFIKRKVPQGIVRLIYNPFDFNRFNIDNCKRENKTGNVVLFPGSLDYLRYHPVKYLLDLSKKQNFKLIHVGRNDYNTLGANHSNFSTHTCTRDMEKYYRQCDVVSGIFLGRTSIEGLLCGKRILQFDVDTTGKINKVYWHTEPNLEKFNRVTVAQQFINEI